MLNLDSQTGTKESIAINPAVRTKRVFVKLWCLRAAERVSLTQEKERCLSSALFFYLGLQPIGLWLPTRVDHLRLNPLTWQSPLQTISQTHQKRSFLDGPQPSHIDTIVTLKGKDNF